VDCPTSSSELKLYTNPCILYYIHIPIPCPHKIFPISLLDSEAGIAIKLPYCKSEVVITICNILCCRMLLFVNWFILSYFQSCMYKQVHCWKVVNFWHWLAFATSLPDSSVLPCRHNNQSADIKISYYLVCTFIVLYFGKFRFILFKVLVLSRFCFCSAFSKAQSCVVGVISIHPKLS